MYILQNIHSLLETKIKHFLPFHPLLLQSRIKYILSSLSFFWGGGRVIEFLIIQVYRTKISSPLQNLIFSLKACFPSVLSNQKPLYCNLNILLLVHLPNRGKNKKNYSLPFCSSLSHFGRLLLLHSLPFSANAGQTFLIEHIL